MSTQDNLKVGGCTCSDKTGGCSNGNSSCACDGGTGGSSNNQCETNLGYGHCDGKGSGGGGGGKGGGEGRGGKEGGSGGSAGGGGGTCGGGGSGNCGGGGTKSGGGSPKRGGSGSKKNKDTYKPTPQFCSEKVRKILKNVLLELLDNTYSEIVSKNLSQKAVSCVRRRVKEMKFDPRYKYVCFITISERQHHNIPVITRTLWNPDTDKCACFSHRTCTILSTILCFGVISSVC